MRNKTRKIFSILILSIMIAAGCVSYYESKSGIDSVQAAKVLASGKCGENAKWSLSDNGTLTISGSGAIYNYADFNKVPWRNYFSNIKKVVIKKGITKIGNHAFDCCPLTSITLPAGLKTIGKESLSRTELTSIHIPASVTSIGKDAFIRNQKMKKITVADNNKNFSAKDNVLYNKKKTKLILVGFGKITYTVPTTVTTIADGAFYYHDTLKTVTISKNVTSLPAKAFYTCPKLETVTINGKITEIKEDTFSASRKLRKLVLPAALKKISGNAFKECYSLKTLEVHANNKNFVMYNNMLLNKNKTILYMYLPMEKETLTLPATITTIKADAFTIGYLGLHTLKVQGNAPKVENNSLGIYHDAVIKYPKGATGYNKAPWSSMECKTYNKNVKITFNANGGTVKNSSKTVTDGKYGVMPVPTRKGYTFQGWYTKKTEGVKVIKTTTLKKFTNHTLYARWKKK